MSYQKGNFVRFFISCSSYKKPGGPQRIPWRCQDCRKAIAERRQKQEVGR